MLGHNFEKIIGNIDKEQLFDTLDQLLDEDNTTLQEMIDKFGKDKIKTFSDYTFNQVKNNMGKNVDQKKLK